MNKDLFTRFSCFLTMNSYEDVRNSSPYSQKNIRVKGLALLLPMLVWFCLTGYITYRETNSIIYALIGGMIGMTFIGLIDAQFVASQEKNNWRGWARFGLALALALLTGFLIEDVVFDSDIRGKLETNKKIALAKSDSLVNERWQKDHSVLLEEIEETESMLSQARQKHIDEMQGKNGRPSGVGRVARELEKYVQNEENKLQQLVARRSVQEEVRDREMTEARTRVEKHYAEAGPLLRIKALKELIREEWIIATAYWTFFFLGILLELFVLINKPSKPTDYDEGMRIVNDYRLKRYEMMRRKMDKALADEEVLIPANRLIQQG